MLAQILLVEDDPHLGPLLREYLTADYQVHHATTLRDAQAWLGTHSAQLIVLDLNLPDGDGLDLVQALRQYSSTPVLILSARSAVQERVSGLNAGADDYLTKPFDKRELQARIQAIIRRSKGHSESVIRTGRLTVNLDARTVEVDGQPLHLTGKEYGILELLSLRKGTTLTKEMFLNHLYGGMDEPELKIIDVFICKLRKKLSEATGGENYIETVWGRGYVLRDPQSAEAKRKLAMGA